MIRKIINTDKAPKAIGPYVQANIIGDFIFTSGQIPLDVITSKIVGNSIEEQTKKVLENLSNILIESGSSLKQVFKTTVFLSDMNNFTRMNEVYSSFFAGEKLPSRSAVEVSRLPKDVLVEIEAIATLNPLN
ncbi:MAG: RidA family protein [Clostridiales Family XIII bacterium]|jgi:2-iminobutanoate/2-iminopropanoate deaminase|nr:RidA family protein [Clostridiales Family XIII bacterium]